MVTEIFYTLREAQIVIESWRRHSKLGSPLSAPRLPISSGAVLQISAEFDNPRIVIGVRSAGGSNRVDYPFSDSLGRDGYATKDGALVFGEYRNSFQMDIVRLIP